MFGESLWNGFWRTDTLANVFRMVFGELTRWRIFGESLGNVFWRGDIGESLENLCPIFGESLANGFWRTDTLANLWRIFREWFLANRS